MDIHDLSNMSREHTDSQLLSLLWKIWDKDVLGILRDIENTVMLLCWNENESMETVSLLCFPLWI